MQLLDPLGLATARAARPALPQITPEQEESLLGRLLSGVGWLGETIDKPFAATRGLLAGDAEQLLHAIPFSSTLGFAPEKKYSGRDLLELYGIAPPNRPGLDPWDVAGLGIDLLAAPPIPVLGPLTAAGRALKTGSKLARASKDISKATQAAQEALGVTKALGAGRPGGLLGLTPKAISAEVKAGLRAPVGLALPWPLNVLTGVKQPLATFGAGSERFGRLWDLAHYGRFSPIPPLRQLFSHELKGIGGGQAQMWRDVAYTQLRNAHGVLDDLRQSQRLVYDDLAEQYGKLSKHAEIAGDASGKMSFDEAASYIAQEHSRIEGARHLTEGEIAKLFNVPGDMPTAAAQVEKFAGQFADLLDSSMGEIMQTRFGKYLEMGGRGDWLEDVFSAYFPRRIDNPHHREAAELVQARMLSTSFGHSLRRKQPLRDVPEGRLTLARLARDWRITRPPAVTQQPDGTKRAAEWLAQYGIPEPPGQITETWLQEIQKKGIADWLTEAGLEVPKNADEARQLYVAQQWIKPAAGRALQGRPAELIAQQMAALFKGTAEVLDDTGQVLHEAVPSKVAQLSEYFKAVPTGEAPFNRTMLADYAGYMHHLEETLANFHSIHNLLDDAVRAAGDADSVPLEAIWRSVRTKTGQPALTDRGLDTFVANYAQKHSLVQAPEELLGQLRVPKETGKILQTYMDVMDPRSDVAGAVGQAWDAYMSLWRAGVTIPFPSFHARNAQTGLWQNLTVPNAPYKASGLGRAYGQFVRWFRGKGPLPYADEIEDIGLLQQGRILDIASAGRAEEALEATSRLPEGGFRGLLSEFAEKPKTWNPLKFRGSPWHKPGEAQFVPFQVGDVTYGVVEGMNRIPPYIAARQAGYTASQAKHLVDTIQYQYSHLAPFERRIMRRFVAPFYSWTRRNVPYQIQQLFVHPIGPAPATVRSIAAIQQQSPDYMPSWVRERLGLPIGRKPGQKEQTYIRSFGLPFDELAELSFMEGRPWMPLDLERTGQRQLSRAAPGVSLAYRLLTRTDPYTGRDLKTLQGVSGIPTLDAWWNMLPAAPRMRSEFFIRGGKAKQRPALTALDLLTGVRVGGYDPEKWKQLEMIKAQRELLEAHPEVRQFTKLYVPKARRKEVDPEVLQQLSLLNLLIQQRKDLQQARQAAP